MFLPPLAHMKRKGKPCCMFSQESTFTSVQPGIYKKDLKGEKTLKISKCWAFVLPPHGTFLDTGAPKGWVVLQPFQNCVFFCWRKRQVHIPGISEGEENVSFVMLSLHTPQRWGWGALPSSKLILAALPGTGRLHHSVAQTSSSKWTCTLTANRITGMGEGRGRGVSLSLRNDPRSRLHSSSIQLFRNSAGLPAPRHPYNKRGQCLTPSHQRNPASSRLP